MADEKNNSQKPAGSVSSWSGGGSCELPGAWVDGVNLLAFGRRLFVRPGISLVCFHAVQEYMDITDHGSSNLPFCQAC